MELPEEMIMEILLRLPVKSLIRFKCVSKYWSCSISSSSFHRWHLNRVNDSSSNSIIVSDYCDGNDAGCKMISIGKGLKEDTFKESMEIDFTTVPGKFFHIKCCCDGMLCLAVADENTLVLLNPAIRVNKRLPLPPTNPSQVLWEVFGFGYDSSIGDYKVVSFPFKGDYKVVSTRSKCDNIASSHQVYVLTLTTNLWRNIGDVNPYYVSPFGLAISVNGGLYWQDMMTQNLILRFDLAKETFKEVASPPIEGLDNDIFQLGHLKGSLCLYVNCELWVMKEEGELWSKIMNFIPLENSPRCLHPLCFTNSGKVCFENLGDELLLYDPKGQTYNKLYTCVSNKRGWFQSTVYTESLISPESGSGMKDID